jgi:hypothetical protein
MTMLKYVISSQECTRRSEDDVFITRLAAERATTLHSRLPDTKGGVCVSTVSIVCTQAGLIVPRAISAGGTDGAAGN